MERQGAGPVPLGRGVSLPPRPVCRRHRAVEKSPELSASGSREGATRLERRAGVSDLQNRYLHSASGNRPGYMAYDAAFRARKKGDEKEMLLELDRCESLFVRARALARETVAGKADDPTEKYILFRYNVRFVVPIAEFCKFIKNVVAFHHGEPYWSEVDWEV